MTAGPLSSGSAAFSGADLELGVSETAPADWPALLAAVPAADFSHTRHWHDCVCEHRQGARQIWWTLRRGERLLGGMGAVLTPAFRQVARVLPLHRLDSSVEGTSGGPLLHPDLPEAEQDRLFVALTSAFLGQRPSGAATAAIALNPLSEIRFGRLLGRDTGWVRQDSPTAMVSLAGGLEAVERDRMVKNKRNERNRGLRRGVEVFATRDADLLAAYYPLYAQASEHWGVAPTPEGLLQALLADPGDRVFLTCARVDGQVIGGHLCLHLGPRVFAWNGVTDPAFARTHFPATLCCWGDLVEACRRGASWLDFGASGGMESLAGFKKYFGAEMQTRGFYVNDSRRMRALRGAGELVGRTRQGATTRWHDGTTGKPGEGEPS